MLFNFEEVMKGKNDKELVTVLESEEEYQPGAVKAAKAEIKKRGGSIKVKKKIKASKPKGKPKKELKGIGGWLILPAIGLVLGVLRALLSLFNDILYILIEGALETLPQFAYLVICRDSSGCGIACIHCNCYE